MYCEIILSQRFPKHLGIFDYKIPEALQAQIKLGQLVTIPFRKSEYEGVVITIKKNTDFFARIKEILKINQLEPILTPEQIKLAYWMSEYYFVSIGTIIKMMLPPIPKTKHTPRQVKEIKRMAPPILPLAINTLIAQLLKNTKSDTLFWPTSADQQTQFMYWLIKRIKGMVLIIVPDLKDIDYYLKIFSLKKLKKTAIIHSQLNKTQFFFAWQQIISGQVEIIIGTKLALFAPLLKPSLIIIDQEENQGHKQADQNPRYDGRTVARQLSLNHQCPILYSSYAPSVDLYHLMGKKEVQSLRPESAKREIQIIDLKDERLKKNYSLFSDDLEQAVNNVLKERQKILLFLNKKGAATSVICKDCGLVLDCNKCSRPLVWHQTNNFLYCHYCNIKNEVPPFCPKCSSVDFKFAGAGTQTVEQQARKIWPNAKITRLDKDSGIAELPNEYDIVIGTEYALDLLDWKKISLCSVISADTFLHLPDFRAAERTWQLLKKLAFHFQGQLIVHTFNPDGFPIRFFPNENDRFYQQEMLDRLQMSYPPFTSLVKLIYQHADKNICLQNTQKLLKILKTSPLQSMILTPMAPRQNNKYRMYLVVKFQSPDQDLILKKVLSAVPDGWIIDRDPVNLL